MSKLVRVFLFNILNHITVMELNFRSFLHASNVKKVKSQILKKKLANSRILIYDVCSPTIGGLTACGFYSCDL
jgi:hypothetical protein